MSDNAVLRSPEFIEAPLVMIEKFAARHNITPQAISEIFCAGVVAMKADGRLDVDACPIIEFVRA